MGRLQHPNMAQKTFLRQAYFTQKGIISTKK